MFYIINDRDKLLNSLNHIEIKNIKDVNINTIRFYDNLISDKIKGLYIFVDNKEDLKIALFLNELDLPLLIISDYDLSQLGLIMKNDLENIDFDLYSVKYTRPFLIKVIEKYIKIIEKELKVSEEIKRFLAVQIIYKNPNFNYLLTPKILQDLKKLDIELNNQAVNVINETIDYFIKNSFPFM